MMNPGSRVFVGKKKEPAQLLLLASWLIFEHSVFVEIIYETYDLIYLLLRSPTNIHCNVPRFVRGSLDYHWETFCVCVLASRDKRKMFITRSCCLAKLCSESRRICNCCLVRARKTISSAHLRSCVSLLAQQDKIDATIVTILRQPPR